MHTITRKIKDPYYHRDEGGLLTNKHKARVVGAQCYPQVSTLIPTSTTYS